MAKSDPKMLTQAEYAKSRKARGLPGGSREAVRKAVDEGRITAFGPDKLLDGDLADLQWVKNTRARFSPTAAAVSPAEQDGQTNLLDEGAAPKPAVVPPAAPAAPDTGYSTARARREIADAERAEIETAKMRGAMVMREDVDRAGFEIARELRDAMESSVNSLGAELAPITNAEACVQILRRHHRSLQDMIVRLSREKVGAPLKGQAA